MRGRKYEKCQRTPEQTVLTEDLLLSNNGSFPFIFEEMVMEHLFTA